jgi:hypothetical protein
MNCGSRPRARTLVDERARSRSPDRHHAPVPLSAQDIEEIHKDPSDMYHAAPVNVRQQSLSPPPTVPRVHREP